MSLDNIAFYIPVHGNYSQVEHTASFIQHSKNTSKIFIYNGFNTEYAKMKAFYESKTEFTNVQVFEFSSEAILTQLDQEPTDRKIVFLLTSSSNYGFGLAQRSFLEILSSIHNKKGKSQLIDVFTVGHCMYGCASCGLSEHNVPIFFNRFYNYELPYNSADVLRDYWTLPDGKIAQHRVLICPTVGPESFLSDLKMLDRLQDAAKMLEPMGVVFAVKMHGFCHLNDQNGKQPHMLFSLTEAERQGAEFLRKVFGIKVVDEQHYNILPFLDAATVIVTDVGSSVPFEALHFPDTAIIAHINGATKQQDSEYLSLLNVFSTPEDMESFLFAAVSDVSSTKVKRTGDAATAFFRSKYGDVDGNERTRIAEARKWAERKPLEVDLGDCTVSNDISIPDEIAICEKVFGKKFTEQGPLDYLARGLEIPSDVTDYVLFEASHGEQLVAKGVPRQLWRKLFAKLRSETFDAGSFVQFARDENGTILLIANSPMKANQDIFLIDHAWSTTLAKAHQQLTEFPALVNRMENILGIEPSTSTEGGDNSADVEKVYDSMWTANNYYCVDTPTGMVDTLYVMDEVGSRIAHSSEPNVRCVPFIHGQTGAAYSIFWPVQDIEEDDIIARDYAEGTEDPFQRAILLYGRGPAVSDMEPFDGDSLQEMLEEHDKDVAAIVPPQPFGPAPSKVDSAEAFFRPEKENPIKVFSDAHLVRDYLKRPEFVIVSEMDGANVRWIADDDIRDYDAIPKDVFVSQFPNDRFVCFKNELIKTAQDVYGAPSWLPESFDLTKDLDLLVARYIDNEKKGKDNHWIAKPWNSGRSSGIVVTKELPCLIRLSECGPYLASKYVENPTLYEGRKYDLRFLVYARCKSGWERPEFFVYDTFWIRFANKQYSLDDLWDYEKHFTVMNYSKFKMTHIKDHEFVVSFEKQHGISFEKVRAEIHAMMAQIFQAACIRGFSNKCSTNSFAVYGIDLILTHDLHPVIEEVNFDPDCTRACNYDPEFYNKTFGFFFLGETDYVTKLF